MIGFCSQCGYTTSIGVAAHVKHVGQESAAVHAQMCELAVQQNCVDQAIICIDKAGGSIPKELYYEIFALLAHAGDERTPWFCHLYICTRDMPVQTEAVDQLVDFYLRRGEIDPAIVTFESLLSKGGVPQRKTCDSLIKECVVFKKLVKASQFFWVTLGISAGPSTSTACNAVMLAVFGLGRVDEVRRVWDYMKRCNIVPNFHTCVVRVWAELILPTRGGCNGVKMVVHDMWGDERLSEMSSMDKVNIVLAVHALLGHTVDFYSALRHVYSVGLIPNSLTLNLIQNVFYSTGIH